MAMVLIFVLPPFVQARDVKIGVFRAAPLVQVEEGVPDGLFIDLIEYFAGEMGWQLIYIEDTWNNLLIGLERGDIDILPAVSYTEERTEIYDFNKYPVFIDSGVLFTGSDIPIHTIFELQGKKVAALEGSVFTTGFIDYISSFGISCNIILTKDDIQVMQAITSGKADAGVTIYSSGNIMAQQFAVRITPISFSPRALHFAVPKNQNRDLLEVIDSLMAPMVNEPDSFYSRAFTKWTAPPQTFKIPRWLKWGSILLAITGIVLGLWSFTLNRQVKMKTKSLEVEIIERTKIEKKLKKSLFDKETLIRELYHRTRNSMQVIRGIINLQASEYESDSLYQLMIRNTDNRIQAMSLVHQMLYSSMDLSRISVKEYISNLSLLILESYNILTDRISVNVGGDDPSFLIDTAIPFGLVMTELITNSLQHAFPDDREGNIVIDIHRTATNILSTYYSDDGAGVPDQFDFRKQKTLGMKLIFDIIEMQMHGKIYFRNDNGIHCKIEIPIDLFIERI